MANTAYWTEERLAIADWIHEKAPSLAELYRGAVEMMYGAQVPGHVTLISHAVREIRNRLPDAVAPPQSLDEAYLNYSKELDNLIRIWDDLGPVPEAGFVLERLEPAQSVEPFPPLPSEAVSVPREVYQALTNLIGRHRGVGNKKLEAALRLFVVSYPESRRSRSELIPAVEDWLSTTEWFMSRAHDSGSVDASCDRDELGAYFGRFEHYLTSLCQPYFEAVEELREIIDDANAVEGPND